MNFKTYSDITLMSMSKQQLIEQLRIAEHNRNVMQERLDNQANAIEKYEKDSVKEYIKKQQEVLKRTTDNLNKTLGDGTQTDWAIDKQIPIFKGEAREYVNSCFLVGSQKDYNNIECER